MLMRLCRDFVACSLIVLGVVEGLPFETPLLAQNATAAAAQATDELKIIVIEGEDGVNIVKKKTAVQPVVEVRDRNNLPVAGVSVTFALPATGPSGTFLSGAKSLTVMTNSSGRAAVASLHPVGSGAFKIDVTASFQGRVATATISQTNYLTAAAAASAGAAGGGTGGGLSTAAVVGIVAGVAAAAAVGLAVGLSGGGKKAPPVTATTIGLGTSTVGAP
jgi:hypothetical protein